MSLPPPPPAPRSRRVRLVPRIAAAAALTVLLFLFRGVLVEWFTGGGPRGAAGVSGGGDAHAAAGGAAAAPGEIAYYTCSMHPSVRQQRPGKCPICAMNLIPVRRAEAASGVVVLDDGRRQEIGIRTGVVERRPAAERVHAVGRVAFDESRLVDVTLKVQGYVTSLAVSQTGQRVERGQLLFTLYSPELFLAQQEYLAALASQRAARRGAVPDRADDLVAAAARKLRLWDLDESEITRLNERGEPAKEIPVRSPASGVVIEKEIVQGASIQPGMKLYRIAGLDRVRVEAQVDQADLPRVRTGERATVRLPALPGRELAGRVTLISPLVDPASRTVQVRIEVVNPARGAGGGGLGDRGAGPALLPDMVAEVELAAPGGVLLLVPESAVLFTGPRTLVFVDEGGGRFRAREVRLGAKSGNAYTVLSGLIEGDRVVTSGQFLLDAEVRLEQPVAGPGS
ncbi:MAG TPA: efflux RND transporter periplasmic adaptor subunit [Thermoanaerobaculia bacterium]|nr:efflux RND transporter periplasmic adaptor subunit [Thermoanaerobaculia bacterium]